MQASLRCHRKGVKAAGDAPYKKLARRPNSVKDVVELNRCVADVEAKLRSKRRAFPRRGRGQGFLRERTLRCTSDPLLHEAGLQLRPRLREEYVSDRVEPIYSVSISQSH